MAEDREPEVTTLVEQFIYAGRLSPQSGWQTHPHRHDHHELVVLLRGRMQVDLATGGSHQAGPGDCLYYPSELVHAERCISGGGLELRYLGWHGPARTHEPVLVHDRVGRIRQLADWLPALAPDDPRAPTLVTALLQERVQLARDVDGLETELRRFLDEHLAEPIRVPQLARALHTSPRHLARRCRAATGCSPRQYLESMRVAAARALLISTDLPLRVIATEVGLGDAYQLSRVVKRVTGYAPGALRRQA